MRVEAEDNAHVLIDFGDARFAVGHDRLHDADATARPRSSCTARDGVLQLLGDDWAPEGYELWRNDRRRLGAASPRADPRWQWTEGLRHLVDCIESGREPVTRPEHAYHALEIMLAAQAAGARRPAREIDERLPGARSRRVASTDSDARAPRPASAA